MNSVTTILPIAPPRRVRLQPISCSTDWLAHARRRPQRHLRGPRRSDAARDPRAAGARRRGRAPGAVWRAWTQPEAFADWFGAPQGEVPLETVSMDVRPGGTFRLTMRVGSQEILWAGTYQEVIEPEHLVFTITDHTGPGHELVT